MFFLIFLEVVCLEMVEYIQNMEPFAKLTYYSLFVSYLATFVDYKTNELPNLAFRGAAWLRSS